MFTGKNRLNNIRQHYLDNHLTPREHKATGKKPQNTLLFLDIRRIAAFLANYAEENAILLPGRVPGYIHDDIQLLPSCTTKKVSIIKYIFAILPLIGGMGALFTIHHSGRIPRSCLYYLFKLLAAIGTTHCCYEANDRSVLVMPEKFSSHNKIQEYA